MRRESTPQPKLDRSLPPGVCINDSGGNLAPAVPGVTRGMRDEGDVERARLPPPAVIEPSVGRAGPGPENDCSNGFGSWSSLPALPFVKLPPRESGSEDARCLAGSAGTGDTEVSSMVSTVPASCSGMSTAARARRKISVSDPSFVSGSLSVPSRLARIHPRVMVPQSVQSSFGVAHR